MIRLLISVKGANTGMIFLYKSKEVPLYTVDLKVTSELNRKEYPELFKLLGTVYGEGEGGTTFNLPPYDKCMPWAMGGEE